MHRRSVFLVGGGLAATAVGADEHEGNGGDAGEGGVERSVFAGVGIGWAAR